MTVPAILNRASPSANPNTNFKESVQNHLEATLPKKLPFKKGFQNTMAALPPLLAEMLLVGSFVNGLGQSLQEALMQLIPRAGAGMVIRKTPLIAVDESILELSQYLLSFILPTMIAVGLSHPMADLTGIPHHELLGEPVYQLTEKLNKESSFGTLNKKQIKLTPEILSKVSVGKLALFGFLAFYSFCMEFVSSGLKVIAVDKLFGTSNFYTISGLNQKTAENRNEGNEAVEQAWRNIQRVLIAIPLALPLFFGLAYLGSRNSKLAKSGFINQSSKIFDLSNHFGLPKTLMAISVLTAALFAYPSVARNEAEKLEVKYRLLFFTTPTVLFFKQVIGNLLAWLTGLAYGLGNILAPLENYFKEVKSGLRNIFDLGLVGIQKEKDNKFSGRLEGLDAVKELKERDYPKYVKAMKNINFMEHWAPYWMALFVGVAVNWFNYLRTASLHEQENKHADLPATNKDNKALGKIKSV